MKKINQVINCATTRVFYALEWPCKKLYIGKTKRQLRVRFNEHLRGIRLRADTLVALHFLQYHQGKTQGLKVKGLYSLDLSDLRGDFDTVLLRKEKSCSFKLNTLQTAGLNNELSLKIFLEP